MELTKSELEVMNVLWQANRPLSRSEILTLSTSKTWKDSSIHILLNGLLNKNAIKEAGYVRSGKTFGRLYAANISCQEYYAKNVFAGSSKEVNLSHDNNSAGAESMENINITLDINGKIFNAK